MIGSGKVNYKPMRSSDLETVYKIEQSVNSNGWTMNIFQQSLQNNNCIVMNSGSGEIIGFLVLQFIMDECHILNICIHPQYQGKGFGKKLLQYALEISTQKNVVVCFLEVRESNIKAINLYNQFGFNEIQVRKNYYKNGKSRENAIEMSLSLIDDFNAFNH